MQPKRIKRGKKQKNKSFNVGQWLPILGVLILTISFYAQCFGFEFVYWDDDVNIYENPNVINFFWSTFFNSTIEIFTSPVIGNYNPLPIWTFGIENAMYGIDRPGNFHFVNVILHLGCTFLTFIIGRQLKLNVLGAGILAFLFALHPMHVESVAWVTERKDVLYGLFYLTAIHLYIKQLNTYKTSRFLLILFFFLLSLLSKIQAVSLPLVFILIDYWHTNEITFKSVIKQWVLLVISLVFGIIGIIFLSQEGSLDTNKIFGIVDRIFIGGFSLIVYLIKSVIPYELSPLYPYPAQLYWYHYISIFIFPVYMLMLYWSYKKNYKILFFGLSFFFINIVFLLQILGAGQGFIADRFSYISYIGLFFIIGYYISKGIEIQQYKWPIIAILISGATLYGYLTYNQIAIWENSEKLWTKAIDYYPSSTLAHGNRANYLRDQGRFRDALVDYNIAISIKPDQAQTLNSRAKLFFTLGTTADTLNLALNDYSRAIELEPNNGEYYINRGATYARLGNINRGLQDINRGLQLKPDHAAGYVNRYVLNSQLGNYQDGLDDLNNYLAINPFDSDFIYERGSVKMKMGYNDNSILDDFNTAIRLNPNKGIYHYRKAIFLLNRNNVNEAKVAYNNALKLGFRNVNPEVANILGN